MNHDALLRAITEEPADYHLRGVYADCLEESGTDPDRVRLIRSGLEHGGRQADSVHAEYQLLTDDANAERWHGRMGGLIDRKGGFRYAFGIGGTAFVRWHWRAGFVEEVLDCDNCRWKECGPRLVLEQPIRLVTLGHMQPAGAIDGSFGWFRTDLLDPGVAGNLPSWLWLYLLQPSKPNGHPAWRWYDSEAKAMQALSFACINYARVTAGLRKLDVSELRETQ